MHKIIHFLKKHKKTWAAKVHLTLGLLCPFGFDFKHLLLNVVLIWSQILHRVSLVYVLISDKILRFLEC